MYIGNSSDLKIYVMLTTDISILRSYLVDSILKSKSFGHNLVLLYLLTTHCKSDSFASSYCNNK